ncbi:MAG: glycosyltransferase family 4 protein [Candidatus Acidiferrales bacterium]|jgi:glycosyltransferase involved in cell wall biosynthesis
MKLLLYSHDWAPTIGGVQTIATLLAQGFASRDGAGSASIDVTLVTKTPRGEMDDNALPYRVVRAPGFFQLASLLREADLIHLAGPSLLPLSLAWLLGKPAVVEHHGYNAICPNGLLFYEPTQTVCPGYFSQRRYLKCIQCNTGKDGFAKSLRMLALTFPRRWLCRRVAANIAVSEHVQLRIQLPRSQVVYHGVQDVSFLPAANSDPSRQIKFAYVGRLVSIKGLGLIVDAIDRLRSHARPFHVDFIGDGQERDPLQKLVAEKQLGNVVSFLGFLDGDALQRAVNDVDVVLMPSIWEETAGLAAMEQMARGKATIVADIGGLSEVVADGGLKFPPGDASALANCMAKLLDDPALIDSLGKRARDRAAELFSVHEMVNNHARVYRKI